MHRFLPLLIAAMLCFAPAVSYAAGGIYFDDFSVTNNGATMFSDNFDDGSISDWTSVNDAAVSSAQYRSPEKSLHLNHMGSSVASAYHSASISTAGLVEASSWVWMPAVQEQYSATFTNMVLYSGNTSNNIFAGVTLRSGESGYRIWLGWNGGSVPSQTTGSVVLAPETWAQLTLRLDSSNSMAYALLNGAQMVSFAYAPENFSSIKSVSVWGWLGDRQPAPVPEPSGILALASGIAGFGGFARYGRKQRK